MAFGSCGDLCFRPLAFGLFAYGVLLSAPTADHLRWWLSEYGRLPLARWPTAYLNKLVKKDIKISQKLFFFFLMGLSILGVLLILGVGRGVGMITGSIDFVVDGVMLGISVLLDEMLGVGVTL